MNGWTAVYVASDDDAVIAYVEEMPCAVAQGATIDEARANLREVLEIMLSANRRATWQDFKSARVIHRECL